MDVAGLSPQRGAHPRAARRSNSIRDRRARRPPGGAAHPEPVRRRTPLPAVEARPLAAAADTADHRQADYFVRLLTRSRRLIDQRIDEYEKAIASADANGDVDAVSSFRRMSRTAEQDRRTLDGLIDQLRRRFPRRPPG